VDTLYEHFNESAVPNDITVDDVINLKPGAFMAQSLANPHIVTLDDASGDWLVAGYGTLLDPVGDSVFVLRRHLDDGSYDIPATQTLRGAPGHGLGAGMAVVRAPTPTSSNRKYFGLVPVLGSPGWLTWASLDSNGTTWSFLGANGSPVTDPLQSIKLIRRADLGGSWQHPAIVYARILGVDYFFVAAGYGGGCGFTASWFRLTFDASNPFGLKFDNTLNSYLVQRWNGSAYINTNGELANDDSWQCASADPKDPAIDNSAADPMDLISLKRADGSVDSILFVYMGVREFGRNPTRLVYTKGSLPTTATANFQWGPFHVLDTSILWDRSTFSAAHTYNACGSGGGTYLGLNQGTGSLAGSLFGHFACYRDDVYASTDPGCFWNCGDQPQGLLPVLLKQQSLGVDGISPSSGPRAGGTPVTVSGEGFAAGATVKLGGTPLSGVNVNGSVITGTTPAHASGAASLWVGNTNGERDALWNGFVYDFDDVGASHPDHATVTALLRSRVTAGCGGNSYCPDNPVTRGQMAVFLLKAQYGFRYPPPPPEAFFTDVPNSHPFASWIDAIFRMSITAGCAGIGTCATPNGNTQFCPDSSITRDQMAVFLLRARNYNGFPYQPPPCASQGITIPDVACVPTPAPYADYIYEVVKKGYMPPCGTGTLTCVPSCATGQFCPGMVVSRKAMSQHLVSAFGLR
jgi:hypothetical protein